MLQGAEGEQTLAHRRVRGAQYERACGGGQGVLLVVAALDLEIVHENEVGDAAVPRHDELTAVAAEGGGASAAGGAHVGAETGGAPDRDVTEGNAASGPQLADLRAHGVVAGIEHGHTAADAQIGEHLPLGRGVGLKAAMPGKMIRRDVEHHGHIRREQARRGQLVAGGLRHVHVGVPGGHRIDASLADVAHGGRVHARLPQQMAGERGRSGLAVGASDGDPLRGSVALAPGEFHLADHLGGGRSGAPIERGVLGNAGARDAQIVGAFDGLVVEEHHGPALAGALGPGQRRLARRAGGHGQRLHAAAQRIQAVLRRRCARLSQP